MEAGPKLNAIMAEKGMGLEVPGWAVCFVDPECCIPWHGSVMEESPEAIEDKYYCHYWPIYLKHCCCEFKEEHDTDVFGHTAYCFEPVPFYSTHIVAAMEVAEAVGLFATHCLTFDELANEWQIYSKTMPIVSSTGAAANTAPLAICLAICRVKGIEID